MGEKLEGGSTAYSFTNGLLFTITPEETQDNGDVYKRQVHTQANAGGRVADLMALSDCPVLPEAVDSGKCMGDWIMLPLLQRSEAGAVSYTHLDVYKRQAFNYSGKGSAVDMELVMDAEALAGVISYSFDNMNARTIIYDNEF